MADYCLPPALANAFRAKLQDGTITPGKMMDMSSDERRAFLAGIIGDDHALNVNALFEGKMLLKDQQAGMVRWAKTVAGINESRRTDLIDKINKLDRVLDPADEKSFLSDLAATKLGVTVTADEAREILNLSKVAKQKQAEAQANPGPESWIAYGLSKMDLSEKIDSMKPNGQTLTQKLLDAANVPKTLATGFLHFSAMFVQNWGMISTDRAWEAFGEQFKYFASEDNYRNLIGYIVGHPDYPIATKAGLAITRLGESLSSREEAFQSHLVERFNEYLKQQGVVPVNVFRASGRAFTGMLNYTRFNRYTDLLEAARLSGEDVSVGSRASRELADVVNNFTGRGDGFDAIISRNQAFLNAVFFAPRKVAATVQMFNPLNYLDAKYTGGFGVESFTARQAAMRQMFGSLIATGAVLNFAKLAGFKVDFDPRSQDFLKPQIGGVKFDLTGGNAIWIRLLARLVTNQEVRPRGSTQRLIELGQGYKAKTRADEVQQYVRGKLAPTAGALVDALVGKDMRGQPFSASQEAQDRFAPIVVNNFLQFFQSNADHAVAAIPVLAGIFGVGVESPPTETGKYKYTVWGQPNDKPWEDRNDPVDAALAHIGYEMHYPPQKLRGVKLSDQQYEQFQQIYGKAVHQALASTVTRPGFQNLTLGRQEEIVRKQQQIAGKHAEDRFWGQNHELLAPAAQKAKAMVKQFGSEAARANRAATIQ